MSLVSSVRPRFGRYVALFIALALVSGQSCLDLGTTDPDRPQTLGVFTEDATVSSVGGVLVTAVAPGSAAEAAGIRDNDILARLDGKLITGVSDLRAKIAAKTLGQSISVVFFRSTDPNPATVSIPIGADAAGNLPNVLGFSVAAATNALEITALTPGGVAELAGLKVGNTILYINNSPTTSLNDAWRILAPLTADSTVTVRYNRPGVTPPATNPSGQLGGFDLQLKAGADAASSLAVPGLFVQDLTPTLAAHFGYINTTGAKITNIYRGTPAFNAGLLVGDIIIGLTPIDAGTGEQDVSTATGLSSLVQAHAGQKVRLRYLRGQLPPETVELNLSGVPAEAKQAPAIGMLLEQLRDASGNPAGLRVEQVTAEGPAATAGLVREDRITQVHNSNVTSIAQFWEQLLGQFDSGNLDVVMQARPTQGSPRFVVLKLAAVE